VEGLLSQFSTWNEYKAANRSGDQTISSETYSAARLLLDQLAKDSVISTTRARARVAEYLSGVDLYASSVAHQLGAVSSADNIVSAAVGKVVEEARAEGGELVQAIKNKVRDKAASGIAGFVARNAGTMWRVAREMGLDWLHDIFN